MKTIAIVSEGITDQVFLEELIFQCVDFEEEPEFVYAQPVRDATHQHTAPHGGWELVFEYCETRFIDAVQANDYAIIQIDTDCGDHPNFALDLSPGGCDKDDETLVRETIDILKRKVGADLLNRFGEKIIFAVCVHSIESWILLCVYGADKKKNSFSHLVRQVGNRDFRKDAQAYEAISQHLRFKNFKLHTDGVGSLAIFITDFVSKVEGCSRREK